MHPRDGHAEVGGFLASFPEGTQCEPRSPTDAFVMASCATLRPGIGRLADRLHRAVRRVRFPMPHLLLVFLTVAATCATASALLPVQETGLGWGGEQVPIPFTACPHATGAGVIL